MDRNISKEIKSDLNIQVKAAHRTQVTVAVNNVQNAPTCKIARCQIKFFIQVLWSALICLLSHESGIPP